MATTYAWWQSGVVYQIYPRSFQDADGDGVGDLEGILQRLDHCVQLGVDAVWLSPVYPSPMADFGYDIADFTDIDPLFGTLADFDALLAGIRQRGLKLILDYVPNHTSDRHPWFEESRASRVSSKRDWYLWRDPAPGGGPPNNWLSHFGGGGWEWDEATGQYYYHSFLKEQPDLNWRNPDVVGAMHDVMRFWLKRGVDGFRVDVLWLLIKDDRWRDNPPNPDFKAGGPLFQSQLPLYTSDRPEMGDVVAGLRRVLDEFEDRVLIGEIYLPLPRLVAYYGRDLDGVHMPFNFQLLRTAWTAPALRRLVAEYEALLPAGAWPNWVLGNHDNMRVASRLGPLRARLAAMLLLTLRGTPTLYYGEELGMSDVDIAADRVQDPFEKNVPGQGLGRDPCRTPMQWDASAQGGFTSALPWLPLGDDHATCNVATERDDPASSLTLYRRLLRLRRAHGALRTGDYAPVPAHDDVIAYLRRSADAAVLIALNVSGEAHVVDLTAAGGRCSLLLSTDAGRTDAAPLLTLSPYEGVMLRVVHDRA